MRGILSTRPRSTEGKTQAAIRHGKPILTILELYRWAKQTACKDSIIKTIESEDDDEDLISLYSDADGEEDADAQHDVRPTLCNRRKEDDERVQDPKG